MIKIKFFSSLLIIAFLSCNVEEKKKKIIPQDRLKNYVDRFNRNDNELYEQFISNDESFEFLNKNIQMIDLPNKEIEEIYYFRWWTYRKHIKNTDD